MELWLIPTFFFQYYRKFVDGGNNIGLAHKQRRDPEPHHVWRTEVPNHGVGIVILPIFLCRRPFENPGA